MRGNEKGQKSMSAVDLEVTIPNGGSVISKAAEETIANAVGLLKTGANPETVIRTIYLFGFFDGGMEIVK